MRTTLIRTTSRATLNALAYQGIRPSECFSQVHDTLEKNLGAAHAACFAEPVSNRQEGFIDWYVPFSGEVRPYQSLSDEEKRTVQERFSLLAAEIKAFAEALIASSDSQKVTRGSLLMLALRYPAEEDLFLVGDTPVVTCWGFAPGRRGAEACNLCNLGPVAAKKSEVPAGTAAQPSSWSFLPWLLPLFLFLLLFCLLFADFGPRPALSGRTLLQLPALPGTFRAETENDRRIGVLEEELRVLEQSVVTHIAACVSEPAQSVSPPLLEPTREELVIPKDVHDTSFLTGRWLCATGLFNSKTQEPVQVEFVFDAQGQGKGNIYEKNEVCSGSAQAVLKDGVLKIEHDALLCAKSRSSYSPNAIVCTNVQGKTECRGRSTKGDDWSAVFLKLKESDTSQQHSR